MSQTYLHKNEVTTTKLQEENSGKGNLFSIVSSVTEVLKGPKAKKIFRKLVLMVTVFSYTSLGALIFQALEHKEDLVHIQQVRRSLERSRSGFLEVISNTSTFSKNCSQDRVDATGSRSRVYLERRLEEYENQLEVSLKEGVTPLSLNLSLLESRWTFTQSIFFAATVLTTIGYGNIAPGTYLGRLFCIAFALIGIPLTLSMIADMGELLASLLPLESMKTLLPRGRMRTVSSIVGTFGLLLLFIAIGGGLFHWLERWTFLDAFYFCFITTTTIGFGDLVPNPSSLLVCGIYILVGLALTSTVIELVRRQYTASFEKMKLLTMRIHQLSVPLADAMRRMAETGTGEIEVDTNLVRELQEINSALTEVQQGTDEAKGKLEKDPWQALLNIAARKKRITVIMYESSV